METAGPPGRGVTHPGLRLPRRARAFFEALAASLQRCPAGARGTGHAAWPGCRTTLAQPSSPASKCLQASGAWSRGRSWETIQEGLTLSWAMRLRRCRFVALDRALPGAHVLALETETPDLKAGFPLPGTARRARRGPGDVRPRRCRCPAEPHRLHQIVQRGRVVLVTLGVVGLLQCGTGFGRPASRSDAQPCRDVSVAVEDWTQLDFMGHDSKDAAR
jgi:hypothetical protein